MLVRISPRHPTVLWLACATTVLLPSFAALAQNSKQEILRTLDFRSGTITLGDDLATINLSERFRYIDSSDAQTFLSTIWDNPPGIGARSLGMIIPVDVSPLANEGWGVVVSYEPSGHVRDDDANKIDYDALLREMQDATKKRNQQRTAAGYPSLELVGWARPPYYDAKDKKLYWAKRLRSSDGKTDSLNYDVRILGRSGVLTLNILGDIDGLQKIDREIPGLLDMVSFKTGNLYSEFNPSRDKAASYRVAGLIAGGVLEKLGFFEGLLVFLLASKKLVAAGFFGGIGALWIGLKAVFRRRSQARPKPDGVEA
jgi:uncharacterized membrane-anchored protein